jgi:uncharacterized protein (DUF1810 family)
LARVQSLWLKDNQQAAECWVHKRQWFYDANSLHKQVIQMSDWDTARFETAQNSIYSSVVSELSRGRKESHWMWFIFPQLRGLGQSRNSIYYGIPSLKEASIYINHPTLGKRLIECTQIMLSHSGKSARQILGDIDATKFKSSMTLFSFAAPDIDVFHQSIKKYYNGKLDEVTKNLLKV